MRAFEYLRKSRMEEEDPDALSKHRQKLKEYAKANKITVVEIFEEVVSGENLYARPEMMRMLQRISDGDDNVDCVLCMDIDRLGRGDMASQGLILETFKRADCKILTPNRLYDLNNDLDETYTEFEAFMARQEYKIIRRRMSRGTIQAVTNGGHVGEVPFGYVRAKKGNLSTLAENPETAKLVRLAFDLYVNQGIGCHRIAYIFNSSGIKPKKCDTWGRTAIRRMLRNEIYVGTVIFNRTKTTKPHSSSEKAKTIINPVEKWIVNKNSVPALVDQETFDKAQAIFAQRSHSAYFTGEFKNPLAGIVYCDVCGKKLQRQSQISRGFGVRLLCPTTGCTRGIDFTKIEQAILNSLEQSLKTLGSTKTAKTQDTKNNDLKEVLEKELKKIGSQRIKIYDLLEQEIYTTEIFNERNRDLTERENKLTAEIKVLNEKETKIISIEEIKARIKNVLIAYKKTDNVNEKNALLRSVISRVNYHSPFVQKDHDPTPYDFTVDVKLLGF